VGGGAVEEGLATARRAAGLDAANGDAWGVMGDAQRVAGNAREAIDLYRKAVSLRPVRLGRGGLIFEDKAAWWTNLAVVLTNSNFYDDAIAALRSAAQVLSLKRHPLFPL
jgi:tetratricopeptide (TPR) repeat protein